MHDVVASLLGHADAVIDDPDDQRGAGAHHFGFACSGRLPHDGNVHQLRLDADGELAFRTRGDANNTDDLRPVKAKKVVGAYKSRIPGAGNVAMFMQTTTGLILCVILPMVLLVAIDLLRSRRVEKSRKKDTDALMKELEELRARQEAMKAPPSVGREDDPPAPVESVLPGEDAEEVREKIREMGDPEPLGLDVAPAEAGLETGEGSGDDADDDNSAGGGGDVGEGGGGDV